jgi:N-acetyl-gamma-glutamyl-phosphate reductase
MTRVHVLGAAGYAAAEFIRYAERHPHLELGALESASHAGAAIADAFPALRASRRTFDVAGTVEASAESGDLVVLAGERDASRERAPRLLARGLRVVDFSDAFRLAAHADGAVYGWTERYASALANANFIANPGCYPTATLLALAPLATFGSDIVQLIVDAKSGITGAGRKPRTELLFAEAAGDVRAYGLGGHRHQPEIEQELAALGITAPLVFTPHVVPIARGMLADCYAVFAHDIDAAAVRAAYARAYDGNPFVRVLAPERSPSLVAVVGTVDAEINISVTGRVVRAISAIDNLGKGAAGQALQSINLMLGYSKETSLDDRGARV